MKTTNNHYDIIVIGAGSAGLTAAISLAGAGKSVLLVERDLPGGECTHSGCVPSKALLHSAKKHHNSHNQRISSSNSENSESNQYTSPSIHALEYARERIDHIYAEETPEILEQHGITVITGEAAFNDRCSINVNDTTYGYTKCIIATGSSPRMIDIPGLDDQDILTNQNFFEQTELPKKLLVIGSGPIGMEMSQAAAMLGSQVTMVTNAERFAHLEDPAISERAYQSFKDMGITVHLNSTVESVTDKTATVSQLDEKGSRHEHILDFDKVLIAIGRVPNIPQGLDQAGINMERHGVTVNDHWQTTNRHVYAVGDVSQKLKFTHTANDTARAVVKRILSRGILGFKQTAVPKVTFSVPEIAAVGMNWDQAVKKYGEQHIIRIETPYTTNDRAKTDNATDGLSVVIAHRLSGKIIGANIIGQSAGEIISNYTLAINQKISLWKLSGTIYAYPTISQIIKKTADEFVLSTVSNMRGELSRLFKKHIAKLFALIFWGSLLWFVFSLKSSHAMSNRDLVTMMYDFMVSNPLGPLLYMTAYVLRPLIFFPATVLTALSGALFGLPLGILFTVIGENGSANLAYWVGRFFGNDTHLEDNRLFGKFVSKARDEPFVAVLLMRFLYVPFDLTNYGSGIMNIRWRAYALATAIGILPGLITFVALGASLDIQTLLAAEKISDLAGSINPLMLVFTLALFVGSLGLARFFKKRHT